MISFVCNFGFSAPRPASQGLRAASPSSQGRLPWPNLVKQIHYLVCLISTHHLETFELNGSAILAKVLYVSCYLACLPKAFALNGSACWGKVLNISCHLACLMSAYQMGAFELNDSTCLGKGLNVSCYPACLVFACPLGAFELSDSACWGKC